MNWLFSFEKIKRGKTYGGRIVVQHNFDKNAVDIALDFPKSALWENIQIEGKDPFYTEGKISSYIDKWLNEKGFEGGYGSFVRKGITYIGKSDLDTNKNALNQIIEAVSICESFAERISKFEFLELGKKELEISGYVETTMKDIEADALAIEEAMLKSLDACSQEKKYDLLYCLLKSKGRYSQIIHRIDTNN